MDSIDEEEKEKWIEQMPQDDQTSFYSISREYENLKNNKCFEVDNAHAILRNSTPVVTASSGIRTSHALYTPITCINLN